MSGNPLLKLRTTNIIYPVIIGISVVLFMFYRKFDPAIFQNIIFTRKSFFWIGVAFIMMAIRDFGYILRLRVLSDNNLNWRKSFRITMLWEFASAVTPAAIGGTSVAVIFVTKEGISIGKSSAIVMAASFLDELYFVLLFPFILLFIKANTLFYVAGGLNNSLTLANKFFIFGIIGYSIKCIYTLVIGYALFVNPRGVKLLLLAVFKLPLLRKWRQGAHETGDEIIRSSVELQKKPTLFWLKAFGTTLLAWTSRYWIVNALFLSFFIVPDHFLLFGKQIVAWIMMLVSPTPGGSGFSEFVFIKYLGGMVQAAPGLKESFATVLAFFWRLISYYPYLLIGSIIFPRWLKAKFVTEVSNKKPGL
jgi:uncharacterized membrane protein YbhN (UPF0104 family)